jgi:hypothetical protein
MFSLSLSSENISVSKNLSSNLLSGVNIFKILPQPKKLFYISVRHLNRGHSFPFSMSSCEPVLDTESLNEDFKLFSPLTYEPAPHIDQLDSICLGCGAFSSGARWLAQRFPSLHQLIRSPDPERFEA